jgi:hypothetical protein
MEPHIAFLDNQHFIPGVTCHLKQKKLLVRNSDWDIFISLFEILNFLFNNF